MPSFRTAEVSEIISERRGLQRLRVDMPDGTSARAYGLTQLIGPCNPGDRVVLNTTAVELDLGTGGWHFVHWNLSCDEFVNPGPEHIMKMRYTSLQIDAGTDELNHPECDLPIDGIPVVVCSVHSQVAAVAASFSAAAPEANLVYVMTDGAALPLALSDLVATMSDNGTISGSITAGHAFGGDMEAVTVPAALGLAVHTLGADAVVVGMGPGVVGTGTTLGTTAIEVAPILDAVADAGGIPILCVRASDGDPRPRHQGISHHTRTVAALTRSRPWVASVPPEAAELPGVRDSGIGGAEDPPKILAMAGLRVTTMGRSVEEDPLFFAAATAAGTLTAMIANHGEESLGEISPSEPSPEQNLDRE
ncbi:MAG TPA: DUF3866 family protein [Microthrixaceae bacterium]|nr:DUF3866 family protein [Microthrixaceae bacterium]